MPPPRLHLTLRREDIRIDGRAASACGISIHADSAWLKQLQLFAPHSGRELSFTAVWVGNQWMTEGAPTAASAPSTPRATPAVGVVGLRALGTKGPTKLGLIPATSKPVAASNLPKASGPALADSTKFDDLPF